MAEKDHRGSPEPEPGLAVALYRRLAEASGSLVLFLDPSLCVVEINRAAAEALGAPDGARGRPVAMLLPSPACDALAEQLQDVVSGTALQGYECALAGVSGTTETVRWNADTVTGPSGRIAGVLLVGQDISRARTLESQLSDILESAIDPIIGIDETGAMRRVNDAVEAVFGWRSDELIGKDVSMLMGEPYRTEHAGYLEAYRNTGVKKAIGYVRRVVGRRRNGEDFPCEISISEVLPGKGPDAVRFVGIVRDNSEKEELSLRLTQAERLAAVGELAAGVAHEINNPISTIINCAQLIRDGEEDPRLVDDIVLEGMRIATIVRDLLDFARDPGEGHHPTSIPDVIARTLSLVASRIEKLGIRIDLDLEADLPLISGREQQLQQVLLNLLLNARDALAGDARGHAKTIEIRGAVEPIGLQRALVVRVRDNGPGIPPEGLARVFQPFFTTKRETGGTGLGLPVSLGILKSHGGSLTASSVPGELTEFRIELPVSDE